MSDQWDEPESWVRNEPRYTGFRPAWLTGLSDADRKVLADTPPTGSPPLADAAPPADGDNPDRDGPILYRTVPEPEPPQVMGDRPAELVVVGIEGSGPAGLIVYGKYHGRWVANAGERYAVRALLAEVAALRQQRGTYMDMCERYSAECEALRQRAEGAERYAQIARAMYEVVDRAYVDLWPSKGEPVPPAPGNGKDLLWLLLNGCCGQLTFETPPGSSTPAATPDAAGAKEEPWTS